MGWVPWTTGNVKRVFLIPKKWSYFEANTLGLKLKMSSLRLLSFCLNKFSSVGVCSLRQNEELNSSNALIRLSIFSPLSNYYRPQRSWGKVIFSQASVILLTRGGLPQCMLVCPPAKESTSPLPRRPPPPAKENHPPCQVHTQGGNWGGTGPGPHPRGELRGSDPGPHPRGKLRGIRSRPTPSPVPPPPTTTAVGGTHPTGMHSCILC